MSWTSGGYWQEGNNINKAFNSPHGPWWLDVWAECPRPQHPLEAPRGLGESLEQLLLAPRGHQARRQSPPPQGASRQCACNQNKIESSIFSLRKFQSRNLAFISVALFNWVSFYLLSVCLSQTKAWEKITLPPFVFQSLFGGSIGKTPKIGLSVKS